MSAEKKSIMAEEKKENEIQHPVARITGNQFYPDMRVVMTLFELSNRKFTIDEVDVLSAKGIKDFKMNNASQSMPYVTIKDQVLMADANSLIKYLCTFYSMDKLYPKGQDQKKVEQILEVVALQFRVTTDRLTKFAV